MKSFVTRTLSLWLAAASLLTVALPSRAATLPPGCGVVETLPAPYVAVISIVSGSTTPSDQRLTTELLLNEVRRGAPGVRFTSAEELGISLGVVVGRQRVGDEGALDLQALANNLYGFQFYLIATIVNENPYRRQTSVRATLFTSDVRYQIRHASADSTGTDFDPDDVKEVAAAITAGDLVTELRSNQLRPIVPRLCTQLAATGGPPSPGRVAVPVGGRIFATVTLADADGSTFAGKDVVVTRVIEGVTLSQTKATDANGQVVVDFPAGSTPKTFGTVKAAFTQAFKTTPADPEGYDVIGPSALSLTSPEAVVTTGTTEALTARLLRDGAPFAGQPITFAADGATVSTTSMVTGPDGQAGFRMTMGNDAGVATGYARWRCTGAAFCPPPGIRTLAVAPEETAELGFVVDAKARLTLDVGAADATAGGAALVELTVDTADGVIADIPVTFSVVDGGSVSVRDTMTDPLGRAQTFYLAPASGSGTATVTAQVTVAGEVFTKSVAIDFHNPSAVADLKVAVIANGTHVGSLALTPPDFLTCGLQITTFGGTFDKDCLFIYGDPSFGDWGSDQKPPTGLRAVGSTGYAQMSLAQPTSSSLELRIDGSGYAYSRTYVVLTLNRPGTLTLEANTVWPSKGAGGQIWKDALIDPATNILVDTYDFSSTYPTRLDLDRDAGDLILIFLQGYVPPGGGEPGGLTPGEDWMFRVTFTPR